MVAALLGSLILGLLTLCQLKRTYTSTGVLVFPLPSMGGVGALAEGLSLQLAKRAVPQDSDLPLDTYSVLLHSDRVLRNVVRALNLETVLARDNPKAHIDEDGAVKWLSERAAVELLPDRTISIRVVTAGTPQVRKVADLIHREAAWDRDKPARELAVQLVVAMIAQMGVVADAIKLDRSKSRLETLRTMRDQAVTVFDQTREQLAALQQRTGNPDPNTYAQEVTRRLVQASGEWRATQARLQGVERERTDYVNHIQALLEHATELPDDFPLVTEERRAYRAALHDYEEQSAQYGEQSSQVTRARLRLNMASGVLEESVRRVKLGALPRVVELEGSTGSLRGQLGQQDSSLAELRSQLKSLPTSMGQLK